MDEKKFNMVKIFDCHNVPWTRDYRKNEVVVNTILRECYGLLKTRGYLFLNEVYQKLGFPLTRQGQFAGWIYYDEDYADGTMWTIFRVREDSSNIGIAFKPSENILRILPEEWS